MLMKLKLDENGHVVVQDGMPVYEYPDGKALPFDAVSLANRMRNLEEEKNRHFTDKEELKKKLEAFSGIEDPAEALKAIETVKNFEAKQLIDAGEVEKLKLQMKETFDKEQGKRQEAFDAKLKEIQGTLDGKNGVIRNLLITNAFSNSPFFSGEKPRTILTPDIAATYFGQHFEVLDDGPIPQITARDKSGEKILSRTRHGEPATFDEAMEVIIEGYPNKDRILSAKAGNGPDANGNLGGGTKFIRSSDMDSFSANLDAIASGKIKVVQQ